MDGMGQVAARAKDRAEEVRAGPQVRDGAEEFRGVAFLLQRVGRVGGTDEFDAAGFDFPFLTGGRRGLPALNPAS